ncbi:MAG TPA: DNA primase [Deltaproteobacteria bacterium]|nr:DNA primase [Deltaproteobacteria bacterium]
MSRIPETAIQEIRNRADIVGFISRYVDLKQAGRNWKGLCPFHDEKTPSFNVNPDRQIFHCFGCQEGGDVIGFLMKHEGLSFPEAARNLASELGIEIPEERGSADAGLTTRLFEANGLAQALYREALGRPEGKLARDYLVSRGFDGAAAERFGIGFAPARWDAVAERLRRHRIPGEIGLTAGLLAEKKSGDGHYDRLRGRLTFPIQDVRGRVIGFGGRALESGQEPKYLNTPESPVFRKRNSFYGYPDALESIRRAGRVILCEGYFDRIAFARAGLGEALATCGTALTADHGIQLRRRTREIVLVFDGDSAGRQATEKALAELLPHGLRVRAVLIPDALDPDDFLEREGADALRRLVDEAPDALESAIHNALRQGATSPDQKADVVAHLAPLLARVADAVSRDEYIRRLALSLGASVPAVASIVRDATRRSSQGTRVEAETLGLTRARRDDPQERQLRSLARLCLRHPGLFGDEMALRLEEILPGGAWKSIILQLIEAAAEGLLIPDGGGVDAFAVEARLDEEARLRLREIAIADDVSVDSDRPMDRILDDLIGWFDRRQRDARQRELNRRMGDPSADKEALLAEKNAALMARRAQLGIGSSGGV